MNNFFEYLESNGVKDIKKLTSFVHNFLQDPSIFFDLTATERDGMEKKWMKPWPSLKLKEAKPAGLRTQEGDPWRSAEPGFGFTKGCALVRKRRAVKAVSGKMTMAIARRVTGLRISYQDGQEPIGKETLCQIT